VKYVSTRGDAPVLDFADTLLAGLARDGGLYVPERWPPLEPDALDRFADLPYQEIAAEVMWPYVDGSIEREIFHTIVADAYATFDVPEVVPLRQLGDVWMLELFHGPTFAFKDIALQLVGRLFDHELRRRGERVTIVGATSGDTGSAAIEACRDRDAIDIFILHPAGRVSDVQRRQMTTVTSPNVHNVAVEGTFDDCQDLVKALFADHDFRERRRLSAVNSINWARVMAQIVYYVVAGARLRSQGSSTVSFAVPTGNFGNVFAGYAAQRMGLPVADFIVASNRNDILTRFFTTGTMTISDVHPTLSPSMDIQVSSNFERLIFDLVERDGAAVANMMERFRSEGSVSFDPSVMTRLREHWAGTSVDDERTKETIRAVYEQFGEVVDPHTAVALAAVQGRTRNLDVPAVVLATAHPAKFPEAVEAAMGAAPVLPPRLAGVMNLPEHYDSLPNDLGAVRAYIDHNLAEAIG
jgi:threonine synthase